MQRFESTHHPRGLPWVVVYSRSLVRPLAACLLPVMIATLVGVLEGLEVIPHALWAAAGAFALASVWTSFSLRRRIAEIRIDGPWVQVRSVADVASGRAEPSRRMLDVRDYGSWADLTIGLTSYEIARDHWPNFERLLDVLSRSRSG